MDEGVRVRVFDRHELMLTEDFDAPVELGRQAEPGEGLYSRRFAAGRWRLVVAGSDDQAVSRRQVLVEPAGAGRVKLTNTSASVALRFPGGGGLAPQAAGEWALPAVLAFGRKTVELYPVADEAGTGGDGHPSIRRLDEATIAPGRFAGSGPQRLPALELPAGPAGGGSGVEVESLLRWLQAVVVVLQNANRSADFFETAARAVVEALGMDTGCVLVREGGRWRPEAHYDAPGCPPHPGAGGLWRASGPVLDGIAREKRTLWRDPEDPPPGGDDGMTTVAAPPAHSVVAAPILDRRSEVIGALYGERRAGGCAGPGADRVRIRKIDAMLLELLASGLAAGLARVELEKAAVAARARFEQFFTPELADELAARPDLLTGREVEVTMLFCDIRGFSRVSERIGPAGTVAWVSDVMTVLSDCVIARHGVLVDYIGDELIAMWGAPKDTPDHARLACLAALDMVERLPELDARWRPTLNSATDVGIGVNTGLAQVGNTGSSRKFKYGALGNTVNLASRVQGATRYLKTRLVITGSTRAALDDTFATRRLGKAAVVNIAEPVEIHELVANGHPGWAEVRRAYEDALARFEAGDFRAATRLLGNLLADNPDDGPSLILMARAVNGMVENSSAFDPVWKLPGK